MTTTNQHATKPQLRSPIFWFGGKGRMVLKLLNLLPPHEHYCEPFGGGASLLFAKRPCGGVEVYNDINEGLYDLFCVLRDEALYPRFKRLVDLTLYARKDYEVCRDTWATTEDRVERAWRWFVVARQSFSGRFSAGWGSVVTQVSRGVADTCNSWNSVRGQLDAIHERLRGVQVECADWRVIIERYNAPGYLVYCDPPYVHGTRKAGEYAHEMTDDDHADLVKRLLEHPAMVMLSGYPHEAHKPLSTAGWQRDEFKTACYAAGRTRHTGLQGAGAAMAKQARTEVVWRNPAAMAAWYGDDLFGELEAT